MRRRPQPNPLRGLLRAGIAVVILVIVLFVVIEIVSSLTAPSVKAPPVIPPTPAKPVVTTPFPTVGGTPRPTAHATARATPRATSRATPRATPRPTAKATAKPQRDVALGTAPLADVRWHAHTTSAPWIATFSGPGDAYTGRELTISDSSGRAIRIGRADPYVRPIWSPGQRLLLYVTVRATRAIPGAAWTLHRFDRASGGSTALSTISAMGLWPLGWRHGQILFAVANGSDTSLYTWSAGRAHFLSILVPQVVSAPSLSPDGNSVAFLTPADCAYCALSIFDLNALTTWFGPPGVPSEYDVAWSVDNRFLVTMLNGKPAAIDRSSHNIRSFTLPAGLPAVWPHGMGASLVNGVLRLTDETTGRIYAARPENG